MKTRFLSASALVGAPMMLLSAPFVNSRESSAQGLFVVAQLLYLCGWACSILAMKRQNAASSVLLNSQLSGLILAATFTLWEGISPGETSPLFRALDMTWPLSHVWMIVVGISTLRARVWQGWTRFAPLACGLVLPVGMGLSAAFGREPVMSAFGWGTALAFGTLACAVWANEKGRELRLLSIG